MRRQPEDTFVMKVRPTGGGKINKHTVVLLKQYMSPTGPDSLQVCEVLSKSMKV